MSGVHTGCRKGELHPFKLWCWRRLKRPLDCKKIQPVHPKGDQSWVFTGRTDVEDETLILLPPHEKSWLIGKDPNCWDVLGAGEEGDDREWDGWKASPTQGTWVWIDSGSWWRTGRPGMLWFTGWQRVGHDWATELNHVNALLICLWKRMSALYSLLLELPSFCSSSYKLQNQFYLLLCP